jgi:hypothetical protein
MIFLVEGEQHSQSICCQTLIIRDAGIITMLLACIAFVTLTDRPATARWLSQEEKDLAIARVKSENVGTTEVLDKLDTAKILRGIFNPNSMAVALIFLLDNVTVQGELTGLHPPGPHSSLGFRSRFLPPDYRGYYLPEGNDCIKAVANHASLLCRRVLRPLGPLLLLEDEQALDLLYCKRTTDDGRFVLTLSEPARP